MFRIFFFLEIRSKTHNFQASLKRNARTEKTKSKKSAAKSLTTDFQYITADNRRNPKQSKK